jgi:hypothetical protein
MKYAKVSEEKIVKLYGQKPNWLDDDGNILSDEWFIENESIYPIVSNRPDSQQVKVKPIEDWILQADYIEQTFWIIDENLPEYNPLLQKPVIQPEEDWIVTETTIQKTYSLVDCTEKDAWEYVNRNNVISPNTDHSKFIEKPLQQWSFCDNTITKTYWEIIEDPDRQNYPDVLYSRQVNEMDQWIKTDTTIQKTYTYTEHDISTIQEKLNSYLSDLRWLIEVSGFRWNGHRIHSDRESQTKILASFITAKDNIVTEITKWKTMDGFVMLSPEDSQNLGLSTLSFVQKLYDTEEVLSNDIKTKETFADLSAFYYDIINKDWPSNSLYIENI